MKQRLKLLHSTGRIPCVDLDTGKLQDWIVLKDSECLLDKETGACQILPDEDRTRDPLKEDLLDDSLERTLYHYRWYKVGGANE